MQLFQSKSENFPKRIYASMRVHKKKRYTTVIRVRNKFDTYVTIENNGSEQNPVCVVEQLTFDPSLII